jgi:antitoxin component HigA of HigAB toxin-antitoxin module
MERENFYILLDLPIDPPETDPAAIEKQIKKKKAQWSKLRNHPTKGLQAQKHISLIPEIEKVMLDPKKRAEELEAAKGEIRKGKESKYPEIDRHIDILMGKGFIAQEEVAKLAEVHGLSHSEIQDRINRKKQQKWGHIDRAISLRMDKGYVTEGEIAKIAKRYALSEEEIRKRVRCPIRKDDKEQNGVEPRHIDKSLEKTINDNLKIVGKTSLYDFLDLPESADLKSLQAQAVRKKKELSRISRKDAAVTAGNTLAGHCMTLFKNEESRNAYDITLARTLLAALDSDIDIAAVNGKVRYEYYDVLIQKAMEFGMDRQEADAYITNYCSRKGYKIERAPKKKKRRIMLAACLSALLLLLAGGGFVYSKIEKKQRLEADYQGLLARVKKEGSLDQKLQLLLSYLNQNPDNTYSEEVRQRISRLTMQKEAREYAEMAKAAERLTEGGDYEAALDHYRDYVDARPEGAHTEKAKKAIDRLHGLLEERAFEQLQNAIRTGNAAEKILACQDFLHQYPDSARSPQVRGYIREMSGEYYIYVKNRLRDCQQRDDWDRCVELCESYISLYDNSHSDQLKQLLPDYRKRLNDQQILQTLKARAEAEAGDYQAAKQLYRDYLEAYPDTTVREEVRLEMAGLDRRIQQQRLEQAKDAMRAELDGGGKRFSEVRNGVVQDRRTGLMWTLVDSGAQLPETCLTYEKAKSYVNALDTGGFTDWRLPGPEEIAGIYKEKPFFPAKPDAWYWTSESYSRYSEGWHTIVDTVSGKNSTNWRPIQHEAHECGAVRAVRGG